MRIVTIATAVATTITTTTTFILGEKALRNYSVGRWLWPHPSYIPWKREKYYSGMKP